MSEDLPEEVNRVELDDTVKDSNGIPAPRATYRASDNTKAILQHGAAAARQVLEAAGARTVFDSGRVMNFAHYMGTARMGTDPKRSVIDRGTAHTTSRTCSSSTAARSPRARPSTRLPPSGRLRCDVRMGSGSGGGVELVARIS